MLLQVYVHKKFICNYFYTFFNQNKHLCVVSRVMCTCAGDNRKGKGGAVYFVFAIYLVIYMAKA